jgi:hypothetical protein
MRYSLRTLLILLAVVPPVLGTVWLTRSETLAALQRSPPESWVQLLLYFVAVIVLAVEFQRRAES